jgi:hypothetical protein
VSTLDFDLDTDMNGLHLEWSQAYESLIIARAEYQALAASPTANADLLVMAGQRLDRAEALKARVMAKIDCLDDSTPDHDSAQWDRDPSLLALA